MSSVRPACFAGAINLYPEGTQTNRPLMIDCINVDEIPEENVPISKRSFNTGLELTGDYYDGNISIGGCFTNTITLDGSAYSDNTTLLKPIQGMTYKIGELGQDMANQEGVYDNDNLYIDLREFTPPPGVIGPFGQSERPTIIEISPNIENVEVTLPNGETNIVPIDDETTQINVSGHNVTIIRHGSGE